MSTPLRANTAAAPSGGRPRDSRIDEAVLQATNELLEEVGYLRVSVAAIAERAGTNKPAIYRRWPTKAHLVHEAVFPADLGPDTAPPSPDLRGDIRSVVTLGVELLSRPAARAALPGLMAETTADPLLRADVLARFATAHWGRLQKRIELAIENGEIRADVEPAAVLEIIAGATLVATTLRSDVDADTAWVDRIVAVIVDGIAA